MRRILASLVAAATTCPVALLAQIVTPTVETWTGAGTSDAFSDAANWADGSAPDGATTTIAVFGTGAPKHSVTLTAPVTLGQLQLQGDPTTSMWTSYFFTGDNTLTLHGGLTSDYAFDEAKFDQLVDLVLAADQTFSLQGGRVYVNGVVSGTGKLTVSNGDGTGYGILALNGANTFTGGVDLLSAYLQVSGDSALGSGAVTIGTSTSGYTPTLEAVGTTTIANAITLTSALSLQPDGNDINTLTFTGPLTLAGDVTILGRSYDDFTPIYFSGDIGQDSTARALNLSSGIYVLSGANTYTGGTSLGYRTAAVFSSSQAVPTEGVITGSTTSYVGIGFGGTVATANETTTTAAVAEPAYQSALVARLDPTGFLGTLGFDTDPTSNLPDTEYAGVNLTAFANNTSLRLGSLTRALLSDTITLADYQNYRFGGGGGTLNVSASLFDQPLSTDTSGSPSTRGLDLSSPSYDDALTLSLRGTNTFTGGISVQNSVLIIDGDGALPAQGDVSLNHGYFGFTENYTYPAAPTAADITGFFGRVTSYDSESVFGLDSIDRNAPRTISEPIDLSFGNTRTGSHFLGTATKVILTGSLTPTLSPNSTPEAIAYDSLRLAAVKEGHLVVNSVLGGTIPSVVIGTSSLLGDQDGTVELNGANTYTGGTTLQSGTLLVGNNSALGTGDLVVRSTYGEAALAASVDGVVLTNHLNLYGDYHYSLELGEENNTHALTLNGTITGGEVDKVGPSTFTLGGQNSFQRLTLSSGGLTFTHDQAALTSGGAWSFQMYDGTTAEFTTAAPVLNSLSGAGTLNLAANSVLTLDIPETTRVVTDQSATITTLVSTTTDSTDSEISNDQFYGTINGAGASLVKNGAGVIALGGSNTYTGGTTINAGTLVAQSGSALGTGGVTVNGGALGLDYGVTLNNSVTFGTNGGTLMGHGTFASPNGITIGTGQTLSPGHGVGTLHFATDLTLASGAALDLELGAPTGTPGVDWDLITVSTQLVLSATTDAPIVINLLAGDSQNDPGTDEDVIYGNTYTFTFAKAASITGFTSTDQFIFNASQLFADTGIADAVISVSLFEGTDGDTLVLNFTPVPEPSTYALMALGLGIVGVAAWRQRRRRG